MREWVARWRRRVIVTALTLTAVAVLTGCYGYLVTGADPGALVP